MVLDPTDLDTRFVNEADHDKAAHDALGLSHDSLSDITITGAQIEALLMLGSANAAWIPCMFTGVTTTTGLRQYVSNYALTNMDGTDFGSLWDCPLPTNMGSLSLHVAQVAVVLNDADAAAYIDHVYVKGLKSDGSVASVADDPTDLTTKGTHPYDFEDVDVTLREKVMVYLKHVVDATGELDVGGVFLLCYYDT